MKRVIGVSFCIVTVALAGGCRSVPAKATSGVDVRIEGHGEFPTALAGRWKADRDGWELVLAQDGHILSAVHSLGRATITPSHKVTFPTRGGGEGVFEPGEWTVHYAPNTRQLTIKVVLDRVRIDMAGTILEGATTDVFSGTIQPDDGVWQVQWTAFNRYTARAPGRPAKDLSTDETYGETKALTFQKVPEE